MKRTSLGFSEGMYLGASRCAGRTKEDAKILDWAKANSIIEERKPKIVEAGLMEDWDCTSAVIYEDGKKAEESLGAYFGSLWATPIIVVDGEEIECYRSYKDGDRNSAMWPEEKENG